MNVMTDCILSLTGLFLFDQELLIELVLISSDEDMC